MGKPKPRYSATFRAEAVALVRSSDKSVAVLAKELGLADQTLRNWVSQAEIDAGRGPAGALTSEERLELQRLRREVKTLQLEREILKKATAFFAKETW